MLATLRRRRLLGSLTDWCEHCLKPIGLKPQVHHRLLLEKLEAVERGDITRLMVMMPPGAAKSTYASVLFPPWFLARQSARTAILASHTADLAEANSGKVIRTIDEFGKAIGLATLSQGVKYWRTNNRGEVKSAGVGGPITGRRADCLTGSTKIQTLSGIRRLDDVVNNGANMLILSYDKSTGYPCYRRVIASAKKEASSYCRVTSSSGRVVEATGEHKFFTSSGYVRAKDLSPGDVLLRSVRQGDGSEVVPYAANSQKGSDGVLLREVVFGYPAQFTQGADSSSLMRDLRSGVQACQPSDAGALLLSDMQGQGAQEGYQRRQESRMAQWHECETGQFAGLVSGQVADLGEGQTYLRRLFFGQRPSGSSHQSKPSGQQARELSHALPGMPSEASRCGAFEAERDAVALVEWVRKPTVVYDIQVEETGCFFADGILVSNCAIIDDPVKSAEDAESERYRDKAWAWYQSDLSTRLKAGKFGEPPARIVLIMTRWHEDDLAGRLLQTEPDEWDTVKLPAQAISDDPLGRAPGEYLWSGDPDYDYGDLLRKAKEGYERNGAMRVWQSLYQQDPRPGEGALFKVALIQSMPASVPGKTIRAWDLAATRELGTRDPDWTVGVRMTKTTEGKFIIDDVVRLRGSPDEVEATIVATASRDGHSVEIRLPQDPGQAGKSQALYLTRKLAGYRVHSQPVTGDKSTRAAPFASQVNVGNVAIVAAQWNRPFLDELGGFPSGSHDDQVDAVSDAFAGLIAPVEPPTVRKLGY